MKEAERASICINCRTTESPQTPHQGCSRAAGGGASKEGRQARTGGGEGPPQQGGKLPWQAARAVRGHKGPWRAAKGREGPWCAQMTSRGAGELLQPATRWPGPRRAAPIARLELEQLDVNQVRTKCTAAAPASSCSWPPGEPVWAAGADRASSSSSWTSTSRCAAAVPAQSCSWPPAGPARTGSRRFPYTRPVEGP